MSPDEYMAHVNTMMESRQYAEALEFALRVQETLEPPLSPRQRESIGVALQIAANILELERAAS